MANRVADAPSGGYPKLMPSDLPTQDVVPDAPFAGPVPPDALVIARSTNDRGRLDSWSLALASAGVPHHIHHGHLPGFFLVVRAADLVPADEVLRATDTEERAVREAAIADAVAQKATSEFRSATVGAIVFAAVLLALYVITGPATATSPWHAVGSSSAALVRDGEWWRTVTALTLHADVAHVLSNATLGAVVIAAVMRTTGPGLGSLLVVASGVLGNVLNAFVQSPRHDSIGFSTAVFGAVGLLAGLAAVRERSRPRGRFGSWAPAVAVVAGTAILALLGSSPHTDVLAHLFGAIAGLVLGLVVGLARFFPRSGLLQLTAGIASVVIVTGAWAIADPAHAGHGPHVVVSESSR